MSEDAKSKLKEKMGAAVSEEELDNVAGGNLDQNYEILNAISQFDSAGVKAIFDKAGIASSQGQPGVGEYIICEGAAKLLKKHLGINSFGAKFTENIYMQNGENLSHAEIMGKINAKLEFAKNEGFEIW